MRDRQLKSIVGCLLGTAVGDAMGLPYTRLSRKQIYQSHTPIVGHNFILNKGMISQDTEHTCMVAQSLIASGGNTAKFSHYLAWRLRFWLIAFPPSASSTTLKSTLKLCLGSSPQTSGIDSIDNSAAVRSIIIGVCYGNEPSKLLSLVKAATTITHNNPQAVLGAIAIAVASYLAANEFLVAPQDYYQTLQKFLIDFDAALSDKETTAFLSLIEQACLSAEGNEQGAIFANRLANDKGISRSIDDTVAIVIQVWLRNQGSYSQSIKEIIYLGGDTNTTAAIVGGIVGASEGITGIPKRWLDNIIDFPRSTNWIASLGKRLAQAQNTPQQSLPLASYLILPRNIIFWIAILFRAFYRLLPPY
ncbi:ADP-ribosylglycohydrolase family protein [Pleurocapsales cyanobacterium LEGE 10410]|nr:ADP-ribosylglycohydrolase family protein [Pleurocapsales cyanobacterium LEGE 10410]